MQKFKGTIYQAINIQNGKSYIGKTTGNFETYKEECLVSALESRDRKKIKDGKYFYNAIRKYGPHNFKWVVLGEIESYNLLDLNEKLNEAEIESIWVFRTFGSDGVKRDSIYGYNMTPGGDGGNIVNNLPNKEEIYKRSAQTRKETVKKDPSIITRTTEKRQQCLKDNPEISIKSRIKISKSWGKKSKEEKQKIVQKFQKNYIDNPEKKKEESKKISNSRIKNKSALGINNPRYIKLNHIFIIKEYFSVISIIALIDKYLNHKLGIINRRVYQRFLDVLSFPKNGMFIIKETEIYLKFVEENKHKIDWYIENYERLEDEYFNKQWEKKYGSTDNKS